ncbi:MAG: flavin reductase family protein [Desulfurococcales archaeon]|nr:flavin reductase family protein [Desulfurococcales archaeon]
MRKVDLEVLERMLYPVVPVLVTAEYNGRVGGMLAAWWMQASFEPPLLAVAIAPERYTYKLVSKSRKFAFNLLDYRYVDRMPYLGDVSERFYKNKITRAGFHIIRGEALGVPIVAEASAAVELKLVDIVKAGDHDIFIGEAVAAYAVEDFENGMWRLQEYKPLLYLGRTRRPGPVYRVYLTPKGWERREIEFARGDLKEASKRRIKVMEEIVEIVRQASSKEEAVEHVRRYLVESGLEEDDAELLVDEAVRRLGRK